MGDERNAALPREEAKITLTLNLKTRSLRVDGDILDRVMVYGILEMAKVIIGSWHDAKQRDNAKV